MNISDLHFCLCTSLLTVLARKEYDEIESKRNSKGYPYRQNMTNLIEGVMVRPDDGTSKVYLDTNSTLCLNLVTKAQKKHLSENFDVLIYEEAVTKCGCEAALLSAIQRKQVGRKTVAKKQTHWLRS